MPSDKPVVHVIDDDKAVRESLAFLLGTVGIDVQTYESANAFLEVASKVQEVRTFRAGCRNSYVRCKRCRGRIVGARRLRADVRDERRGRYRGAHASVASTDGRSGAEATRIVQAAFSLSSSPTAERLICAGYAFQAA